VLSSFSLVYAGVAPVTRFRVLEALVLTIMKEIIGKMVREIIGKIVR
jgi:hypothetical protein